MEPMTLLIDDREFDTPLYADLHAKPIAKFNPNHDEKGRFASAEGGVGTGERTNTPAFKAWFRQSKVVDAQGAPLTVYRGDRPGKTLFTGREDPSNYIQGNIFFSDVPYIGKFYTRFRTNSYLRAEDLNESHGLYRSHLSLQHPLIVDAKEEGWDAIPFRGGRIQIDDLALKAQGEGYDGLIVRNVYDQAGLGTQFAAFKPEQIKSVNNRGTYGRTHTDIYKEYDEALHPRDEKGLWTTADGGAPLQLTGPPPTKGPSYMTGPATREAFEAPLRAAGVRIGNVDDLTDKTLRDLDVREHEVYTTDDVLAAQGVADGILLAREDSSVLAAVKDHMREVPIVFMDLGTHGQMVTCLQNGKTVIIVNLLPEKMLRLHHFASDPTKKNTVATDIAAKVYKEKGMEAAIRAEHQASIWHEMGHIADVISGRDYTNLVTSTLDDKFPGDYFGYKASRWAFTTISHYAATKSVEAAAELFVKVQARQRLPPTMKPVMDALLR